MLNAYFYRLRRAALKRPWRILIGIFLLIVFSFMMAYPTLMSMSQSEGGADGSFVQRDVAVVTGGMYLILLVMFNFLFYTGLHNGVVGFSTADVNFHMAGPFTPKFNLIIAASGTFRICLVFTFFLSMQTALIYQAIGVSTPDLLAILAGTFVSGAFGYFTGSYFGARYCDNEKKKNLIAAVGIAFDIILPGSFVLSLLSGSSLKALGVRGVIAKLGGSIAVKAFPGAGWTAMIYDGIINGSPILTLIGTILTAAFLLALVMLYIRSDFNYYDEAILFASKAADIAEQKRAGIDADTASMTRRAKVGKESLGKGEGASAFTAIHFLMNKRGSKFFFINPLASMYRVITAVYLGFMAFGSGDKGSNALIISAFSMMIILNAIVFAGGKTVIEFTKPFIYLVPEPSNKKLMACLKSDIPEMGFDSLLCGALMVFFCNFTLPQAASFAFMMIVFDLLCEMAALLIMRLLPFLGRHLLMLVRYFFVLSVILIDAVPLVVVTALTKSLTAGTLAGAAAGIVMLLILTPIASVVVARQQM